MFRVVGNVVGDRHRVVVDVVDDRHCVVVAGVGDAQLEPTSGITPPARRCRRRSRKGGGGEGRDCRPAIVPAVGERGPEPSMP